MKWIIVFTTLCLTINLSDESKFRPSIAKDKTHYPIASATITLVDDQTSISNQQHDENNSPHSHWYEFLKRADWWVVAIAALTLLVLYKQAKEMERATKAMERSSGVLMDTEQGRVVTYWEKMIHLDASRKGMHDGTLSQVVRISTHETTFTNSE